MATTTSSVACEEDYKVAFKEAFHVSTYNWMRRHRRTPFLTRTLEYVRQARAASESKPPRIKRRRLDPNDMQKMRVKQEESPETSRAKRTFNVRLSRIYPSADRLKKKQDKLFSEESERPCVVEVSLYEWGQGKTNLLYRSRQHARIQSKENAMTFGPDGLRISVPEEYFASKMQGQLSALRDANDLKWVVAIHSSANAVPKGIYKSANLVPKTLAINGKSDVTVQVFSLGDLPVNGAHVINGTVTGITNGIPYLNGNGTSGSDSNASFLSVATNLTSADSLVVLADAVSHSAFTKAGRVRLPIYVVKGQDSYRSAWELDAETTWVIETREPLYAMPTKIANTLPNSSGMTLYHLKVPGYGAEYIHKMPSRTCAFCPRLDLWGWKCLKTHLDRMHGAFRYTKVDQDGSFGQNCELHVEITPRLDVQDHDEYFRSFDFQPLGFEYISSRRNAGKGVRHGTVKQTSSLTQRGRRIIKVPVRGRYFHSQSVYPIRNNLEYVDSEDDIDEEWKQVRDEKDVDEIVDVTRNEKVMMKLWMRHVQKYKPIGDVHVPDSCLQFSKWSAHLIREEGLRGEFVLHLLNLVQYGLIDEKCFASCLDVVDREAASRKRRREPGE